VMVLVVEPAPDCKEKKKKKSDESSGSSSSNRETTGMVALGCHHCSIFSCYHSFPLCALAMERAYCTQQQMIMTKIDSCEVGFM
jgi:hypothetical protein